MLGYEPYVAMLAYVNESRELQTGATSPTYTRARFKEKCDEYLDRIQHWATAYGAHDCNPPDCHLFRPETFLAIGHVDTVCIALFDSHFPFLRICAEQPVTIEQVTLAFCPSPASLGITELVKESLQTWLTLGIPSPPPDWTPIVAPRYFFEPSSTEPPIPQREPAGSGTRVRQAPFLVIARLKVSGLVSLGNGAVLDYALFRTVTRSILASLQKLLQDIHTSANSICKALHITAEQIFTLRVSLLDSQGADDISFLLSCDNLSLAMSVLEAISCLELGDLWFGDREIEEELTAPIGLFHGTTSRDFIGNHIFYTSHTTVCVTQDGQQADYSLAKGFVEAYGRLKISPGHALSVEDTVADSLKRVLNDAPPELTTLSVDRRFQRLLLGTHDYDYSLTPCIPIDGLRGKDIDPPNIAFPIRWVLESLRTILWTALTHNIELFRETTLVDTSTRLVVPIPRIACSDPTVISTQSTALAPPAKEFGRGHQPLSVLLKDLGDAFAAALPASHRDQGFSRLRLPSGWATSIGYLYNNYENCLRDSEYFARVLDLDDAFRSLHHVVTEAARKAMTLRNLPDIIEALSVALGHRMNLHASFEQPDRAVDFRGGLHKLISAVDVPMRCATGLVRDHITRESSRPRFGSVTRLSNVGRTGTQSITIGDVDLRLFTVPVEWLFEPADLCVFIHEAAHLLFEDRCSATISHIIGSLTDRRFFVDRMTEVFCNLVMHLFIFEGNTTLFLRYQSINFSVDPERSKGGLAAQIQVFCEHALRAFLTVLPIMKVSERLTHSEEFSDLVDRDRRSHWAQAPPIDVCFAQFWSVIQECLPFYFGSDQFRKRREFIAHVKAKYDEEIAPSLRALPYLWREAWDVYRHYCVDYGAEAWRSRADRQRIRTEVKGALDQGRVASPRVLARKDELALVCELLRHAVTRVYSSLDAAKELFIDKRDRDSLRFSHKTKVACAYNDRMFDASKSVSYCWIPAKRREQILSTIATVKTLSGIGRQQCARRIARLKERA